MKRPLGGIKQLPALPAPVAPSRMTLRTTQNACYEALSLALKEGHVFAALTGPEGSGKTTVLEAVLSDRTDRALRCIRISDPDKVPASLATQIEQVAYAEAGKPENLERHIVLAIDDAHTSSHELLLCLSRLAAMREPGRRVPQILLVGRSELWDRLAFAEYEVLARRVAIRAALPAAEEDADPWASVEDEVTQTMTALRAESDRLLTVQEMSDGGFAPEYAEAAMFEREYAQAGHPGGDPAMAGVDDVPPPSMYALFPDPPPKSSRSAARETRRRLVMPLVSLFVGLAAFAFALSFYDWPDLLGELPWSDPKPTAPFVLSQVPQANTFGMPLPPTAAPAARPKPAAGLPKPAPASSPIPGPQLSASQLPAPSAPVAPAPARQIAVAQPPEKPAQAAPIAAETPARPEPASPPVIPQPAPAAVTAAPVSTPVPAPTIALAPSAPARAPAVAETPLPPAVMALLLRRGDEQSAIGDVSAARLFYERAAEAGSGLAARQMGRSYDAAFLPPAVGTAFADLDKAKLWYQRAASLGNTEAAARLRALSQGR